MADQNGVGKVMVRQESHHILSHLFDGHLPIAERCPAEPSEIAGLYGVGRLEVVDLVTPVLEFAEISMDKHDGRIAPAFSNMIHNLIAHGSLR